MAAFEAKQAEIDVSLIYVPDQRDYRKRMGADFAAGTPADIVLINYRRYAAFAARGVLEPLAPYLGCQQRYQGERVLPGVDAAILLARQADVHPAKPVEPRRLLQQAAVRRSWDRLPAADWTWDDFLATAKALTRDTDGDGRTDQFGVGTEASISALLRSSGRPAAIWSTITQRPLGSPSIPPRPRRQRNGLSTSRSSTRWRRTRWRRNPRTARPDSRTGASACSSTAGAACRPTGKSAASTGTSRRCRRAVGARASCMPTPTACQRPTSTRKRPAVHRVRQLRRRPDDRGEVRAVPCRR